MQLLKDLCLACSPSGSEGRAIEVWDGFCGSIPDSKHVYNDKMGNSIWSIGHGATKVLLSGHIDEVHARVTSTDDDGMCGIVSCGGIDARALQSSEVIVMGDNGDIKGFIGKKPLHLDYDDDKRVKMEDLRLDVGAHSKEDLTKLGVRVGTIIVHARQWSEIGVEGDTIVATGLDDKVGVYASYEIMRRLMLWNDHSWADKYTIYGAACTQEETGLRGAKLVAKWLSPDISIDFDVTFCSDGGLGIDKNDVGDVKLGCGAVINYGPDKSERINSLFRNTSFEHQAIAARAGGTNTRVFQEYATDCETTIMSIPNRNMHTQVEMVSKKDVESLINTVLTTIVEGTI